MSNTDHCVFDFTQSFVCEHCGARQRIDMPIDVRLFSGFSTAFIDLRRDCKPKDQNDDQR